MGPRAGASVPRSLAVPPLSPNPRDCLTPSARVGGLWGGCELGEWAVPSVGGRRWRPRARQVH